MDGVPDSTGGSGVAHRWTVSSVALGFCVVELFCEMTCKEQPFCPEGLIPDVTLYSLQDQPLGRLHCPVGFDCNQSASITLNCCGNPLTADLSGMTDQQRNQTINDLIAQCQIISLMCNGGNPTTDFFYNDPQTCSTNCPDGSKFTLTIPAGAYLASSLDAANALAKAACQEKLPNAVICLGDIPRCICYGRPFSTTLHLTRKPKVIVWSLHGTPPPGITVHTNVPGASLLIDGTPAQNGTYTFAITASDVDGNSITKNYTLVVLQVTTTSLNNYTIGVPYSQQLQVVGGSGNYGWRIAAGQLPDGLTLSKTGLISGTPTAALPPSNPVLFGVVDTFCDTTPESTFPPHVQLVSVSNTKIATVLGFSEIGTPSTPPKKYKSLTWDGTSEQTSKPLAGTYPQSSDIKFIYSGSSVIDSLGNFLSHYSKNRYVPCPASDFSPLLHSEPTYGMSQLLGYCWTPDPSSCPVCNFPPIFKDDVAQNSTTDEPFGLIGVGVGFTVYTKTQLTNTSGQGGVVALQEGGPGGVSNFPLSNNAGGLACWVLVEAVHNYSATLTDEYTDQEALAHAQIILSNGTTAENLPRTTGFISRFTAVQYSLVLTNLIKGKSYVVTVNLRLSWSFQTITKQYPFTANDTTGSIVDNVPNPIPGGTITVLNPKIKFA